MPKALDFFKGKKVPKNVYESVKKQKKNVVLMTKRDPQPKWD